VLRDLRLEDWEGLKAGEYTVQLRLGAAISNRIKLKVVKRGRRLTTACTRPPTQRQVHKYIRSIIGRCGWGDFDKLL
jgi:hypothetical protein